MKMLPPARNVPLHLPRSGVGPGRPKGGGGDLKGEGEGGLLTQNNIRFLYNFYTGKGGGSGYKIRKFERTY